MAHSFSFSFEIESDDIIEEDRDETVEAGPSPDFPQVKPVAVTEPRLHKLQDLVGMTGHSSILTLLL